MLEFLSTLLSTLSSDLNYRALHFFCGDSICEITNVSLCFAALSLFEVAHSLLRQLLFGRITMGNGSGRSYSSMPRLAHGRYC